MAPPFKPFACKLGDFLGIWRKLGGRSIYSRRFPRTDPLLHVLHLTIDRTRMISDDEQHRTTRADAVERVSFPVKHEEEAFRV